jgi:hypothetical protein
MKANLPFVSHMSSLMQRQSFVDGNIDVTDLVTDSISKFPNKGGKISTAGTMGYLLGTLSSFLEDILRSLLLRHLLIRTYLT